MLDFFLGGDRVGRFSGYPSYCKSKTAFQRILGKLYLAERKGMLHFHLGSIISHIQVRFSGATAHFPWAWLLTDCVVGSENHGSQECTFDFVSWCSPESHRQTWRSCCVPEHPPSCILVEMLRILCRKQAHPARGVLQWSGSSLEVWGSTADAVTGA